MADFFLISNHLTQQGYVEIKPKFIIKSPSKDLMIRNGDFYAVWVESRNCWSTVEQDVLDIIDSELDEYAKDHAAQFEPRPVHIKHMWDPDSGMIDKWHKYCQQQMRDSYHMLDETLIFSNTVPKKEDYSSKHLDYPLAEGSTEAWDKLIGQLYGDTEKHKIEWCIGAIVSGASKTLQKFMVLYGDPGSGKSTLLDIIDKKLFKGYSTSADSSALGSASNNFSLESFKENPLVAIQHEAKLNKIEDNTRLNSLVSHDKMVVNVKHKSVYTATFKTFLIVSSNEPVKITNAKSGLLRRLIDVNPTGNLLEESEYEKLKAQIDFELGAIAWKCLKVYEANPKYYNHYIPTGMLRATNDFYNFISDGDAWTTFKRDDYTTAAEAWALYKSYVDYAKVQYPYSYRVFREELKNYFDDYKDRVTIDGVRIRGYYSGFRYDKFDRGEQDGNGTRSDGEDVGRASFEDVPGWLRLQDKGQFQGENILDEYLKDCKAQYAPDENGHMSYWSDVTTTLSDLDTSREHFSLVPSELIVVDFDISTDGEKDLQKNLAEAAKWPPTYAEVSKSGKALHLHYIYEGDKSLLSSVYADQIEIKTLTGNQALRRKLTLCNDIPIAKIASGLPLKEVKKTYCDIQIKSEKSLRDLIVRNLNKEIHNGTKPSVDFIYKILDDTYNSGLSYDVSNMRNAIISFAAGSTHHADYCLKLVSRMKFMSDDKVESNVQLEYTGNKLHSLDIEVYPNLFLVCYKEVEDYTPDDFDTWDQYVKELQVNHKPVIKLFNPKPYEVEDVLKLEYFGHNVRRYDNHILYARMMGYSVEQLFKLSTGIVNSKRSDSMFGEAYNLSYTDTYDMASAGNKKSLKKLEIEMGYPHMEMGIRWDQPVPKELWKDVADYCENDVLATEAAFRYLKADYMARLILADIAGMTPNDTTNSLTTRIIFNGVRKPQSEFQYRNLAEPVKELTDEVLEFLRDADPEMMSHLHGEEDSLLPYFPNYIYSKGVSTYRDEVVGEGGYVFATTGTWQNVALLDVASMHPHSIIAECLFGPRFTRAFKQIVDGRVSIKHEAWDECDQVLGGKLKPYIERVKRGEMTSKDLANALKTAINSVYGLTSAAFENAFRDPRNKDNIVAKRGALFMINLKNEVQARGYTVAHIKTDSIKIPNADPDIINFVMAYGKDYGYTFEHEATYDRMCLVNESTYIAKYATAEDCIQRYGYSPGDNKKHGGEWTATGKQFQVPYVFKTLFTHEPIEFNDMCETFSVTGALYLDNNETLPDVTLAEKEMQKLMKTYGFDAEDLNYLRNEYTRIKEGDNPEELKEFLDDVKAGGLDVLYAFQLDDEIAKGHNYQFVGRVGQFTPVKPGTGGGLLLREADGKYSYAAGAKGYRWVESTTIGAERVITGSGKPIFGLDDIDRNYYIHLVDEAREAISGHCDFEWFAGD